MNASVIVNLQVVPMAMGWRALALAISSETDLLVTAVEGTWSHDLTLFDTSIYAGTNLSTWTYEGKSVSR